LNVTKDGGAVEAEAIRVVDADDRCPELRMVQGDGVARAVIWPGMGAAARSMHRITLRPGARTTSLRHPMEAVYYVVAGMALVEDQADGAPVRLRPGSMVFVEPDTTYVFAAPDDRVEIVGGPCPPDESLYYGLNK
jgi:mannose-6-phosphate isomerase-like protein (cupin superfamily)